MRAPQKRRNDIESQMQNLDQKCESDKQRFVKMMLWLCRKHATDGVPRALPDAVDLEDYYAALSDIPIEDLE